MKLFFLILYVVYSAAVAARLARQGFRRKLPASPARGASGAGGAGEAAPARRLTRLVVIGGTGGTGRELIAQALARGHAVTALVRTPAKLQIAHPQLRVIQGDVLDYASVESAVRGQEAVVCALGHNQYFHPTRILSEGTRNLLRAMHAHGVPRFVCETTLGIGDSVGRLGLWYTLFVIPVILPFYFSDKTRQEQLIGASPVKWVIVRPGALTNGAKRSQYRHGPDQIGSYLWTVRVSRADVADFMLNQLADDASLGTAQGVCW